MAIYRHSPEQVQEYYEAIGINQSALKLILDEGIEMFLSQYPEIIKKDELYYEEKKHFIIGKAVDSNITHGEDIFNQQFHISQLKKKPGPKSMSVIKLAFDKARANFPAGIDANMAAYKEEIYDACNEQEYFMNRAAKIAIGNKPFEDDKRIETLLKDNGNAYWVDLSLAEGKQILADDEAMIANAIIMSWKTHKHTAHLFKDSANVDIVYQFPLFWSYNDVDCKGLIDMIIIDHTNKRIIPIDLKTLGDFVTRFNRAILKRRYDVQGSFYHFGLSQCLTQLATLINKPLTGYSIANFAFVVESTIRPGCPLVFPMDDSLMLVGKKGNGDNLSGWEQGIELFKEWSQAEFKLENKFADTNGVIFVDRFFEYNINF